MNRAGLGLLLGLLLSFPVLASAKGVVIETLDGTSYTGKIVKETPHAIVMQIKRGSITGTVRIPRSEIKASEDLLTGPPAELQEEIDRARATEDPPARVARSATPRVGPCRGRPRGKPPRHGQAFVVEAAWIRFVW